MYHKNKVLSAIVALGIIGAAFGIGFYSGSSRTLAIETIAPDTTIDMSAFWKVWNILDQKYVPSGEKAKITDEQKMWGAIKGLAESYNDPYTVFMPPQENKDFQAEIRGNLEGVGMEVGMRDGIITVVAPLKGTPAFKAGVKAGDKILKIDDTVTSGLSVDEAVHLIRGKKGTTVKITLLSIDAKEPREVSIVRDVINIPTIDTEKRSDGIFVIKLYNFSENSANLFRNALREFSNSGSNKVILDLRGNPGGYLEASVDMASWFLPSDKIVVTQDLAGNGEDIVHKSNGYNVFANKNIKMMILVDGGSASASEILAGALQEHGIAKLVGQKTYGKGSVQELLSVTDDTSLKVTIARWLTPNGISISEQGLKPDFEVARTTEQFEKGEDPQLDKAVELLK